MILPILLVLLFAQTQAPPENAEHSESGLIMLKLGDGTGSEHPGGDDLVKVRFSIWDTAGTLIDSIPENQAAVMAVSRMMPGWREAVSKMVAGERRRAWVPSPLGGGKIREGSSFVIDTRQSRPCPLGIGGRRGAAAR